MEVFFHSKLSLMTINVKDDMLLLTWGHSHQQGQTHPTGPISLVGGKPLPTAASLADSRAPGIFCRNNNCYCSPSEMTDR